MFFFTVRHKKKITPLSPQLRKLHLIRQFANAIGPEMSIGKLSELLLCKVNRVLKVCYAFIVSHYQKKKS